MGRRYFIPRWCTRFCRGTVVHINAAVAGLVGAYLLGHRTGLGKEAIKPHNLPMVFMGTLYYLLAGLVSMQVRQEVQIVLQP